VCKLFQLWILTHILSLSQHIDVTMLIRAKSMIFFKFIRFERPLKKIRWIVDTVNIFILLSHFYLIFFKTLFEYIKPNLLWLNTIFFCKLSIYFFLSLKKNIVSGNNFYRTRFPIVLVFPDFSIGKRDR